MFKANLADVRDIASCFTGCDEIISTSKGCVVVCPDADQADGVHTLLKRNDIKSTISKANFTTGFHVSVLYAHNN